MLEAFSAGTGFQSVPGINENILAATTNVSRKVYAASYRLGWSSIIPFVVIGIVCVYFLNGVKDLMTEEIEATAERESDIEKTIPRA